MLFRSQQFQRERFFFLPPPTHQMLQPTVIPDEALRTTIKEGLRMKNLSSSTVAGDDVKTFLNTVCWVACMPMWMLYEKFPSLIHDGSALIREKNTPVVTKNIHKNLKVLSEQWWFSPFEIYYPFCRLLLYLIRVNLGTVINSKTTSLRTLHQTELFSPM